MERIQCVRCGKKCSEAEAFILDISISSRSYANGGKGNCHRHDGYVLCPECEQDVSTQILTHKNTMLAAIQGRTYAFPDRLAMVGEMVYEVVDGNYPIVKSLITKFENGRYEAVAKNIPDAGTISFSPFDIGNNLFLTEKEALAEKKRRKAAKQ